MFETPRVVARAAIVATALLVPVVAQDASRTPAQPLDPVTAIVDAFASHSIVALGEGPHTNEQGHAFRLALIRHPRFVDTVNDVVVESGSARYQERVDSFVRGGNVSDDALREVFENTAGAAPVWDRPIYADFFRGIRDLNRRLPPERQLRILLGDPPIDWATVRTSDDYRGWLRQRDSHPAEIVRREVLAKGRRALVIYGDGHLQARTERPARSLIGVLESSGAQVFNVTTTFADLPSRQPDVASWRVPTLAHLRGTVLGSAPYEMFLGPPPPTGYFKANPRIEDHFDAVLYLGPASAMTMAPLSYPRCTEPAYIEMRVERMVLSGSPPAVADRLKRDCAAAAPPPPAFDAASVRPSQSNLPGGDLVFLPGGRFTARNELALQLIAAAYNVETFRIVGGPAWINRDGFDVQAQAGANITLDETRLMLRTLLADRFKLRVRMESRDMPIYALVLSRTGRQTGPRLQPASPAACVDRGAQPVGVRAGDLPSCGRLLQNPGRLTGRSVPLALLATRLSSITGRVVTDRTSVSGLFDIDAEWGLTEAEVVALAPLMSGAGRPPASDPNKPSLFRALPVSRNALAAFLEEQLGLRLESSTGSVDVVVVDSVERPTEN